MTPDEKLAAYVDGELSRDARAAFEAEMAADPRLAAQVETHRALSARLAGAYAPVLDEPVPERLTAVARPAGSAGLPQWAAMAACFVVGIAAGVVGVHYVAPEAGPFVGRDGEQVAVGALESALTYRLASQAGPIRVGLTFRTAGGGYCRTFQSDPDRLAGLACRRADSWVMQTASALDPAGPQPAYRPAASETPRAVLAAVDEMISGEPLDAAAERAARDGGWK